MPEMKGLRGMTLSRARNPESIRGNEFRYRVDVPKIIARTRQISRSILQPDE
jgi:hypothetical protein